MSKSYWLECPSILDSSFEIAGRLLFDCGCNGWVGQGVLGVSCWVNAGRGRVLGRIKGLGWVMVIKGLRLFEMGQHSFGTMPWKPQSDLLKIVKSFSFRKCKQLSIKIQTPRWPLIALHGGPEINVEPEGELVISSFGNWTAKEI